MYYIDDLIIEKFTHEKFLFSRINDWKQFFIDKNFNLHQVPGGIISKTKEYDDYIFREGKRIDFKHIHTKRTHIFAFNHPQMTFRKMRDTVVEAILSTT